MTLRALALHNLKVHLLCFLGNFLACFVGTVHLDECVASYLK